MLTYLQVQQQIEIFIISVQNSFDDNFYEIDLNDEVITSQPETKENKSKDDENNLVSR
jgi:hypothetical protein